MKCKVESETYKPSLDYMLNRLITISWNVFRKDLSGNIMYVGSALMQQVNWKQEIIYRDLMRVIKSKHITDWKITDWKIMIYMLKILRTCACLLSFSPTVIGFRTSLNLLSKKDSVSYLTRIVFFWKFWPRTFIYFCPMKILTTLKRILTAEKMIYLD